MEVKATEKYRFLCILVQQLIITKSHIKGMREKETVEQTEQYVTFNKQLSIPGFILIIVFTIDK